MENLEKVKEFFANDRFATENGAVIEEVREHYAKCSLVIKDKHKNAMGAVMGGVYFTIADFAFAVATNWKDAKTVSLSSNITFLSVAKGEKLYAIAKCIRNGRTTCYYNIDVYDDLENHVAAVSISGYNFQ